MKDNVSISRVALLHPKVRDEVVQLINQVENKLGSNMAVRIVQGLRTFEEQDELYQIGRTKPGKIVTNARGGFSFHNYGVAIDFAILHDKNNDGKYEELSWDLNADFNKDGIKDWNEVVSTFKSNGWEWGGDWHSLKDYPHLQKTFGNSINAMLNKYNNKEFISGTNYIDLN